MKKIFFFILVSYTIQAQNIDISIFSDYSNKNNILFKAEGSDYTLNSIKKTILCKANVLYYFTENPLGFCISDQNKEIECFDSKIELKPNFERGYFRISVNNDERLYKGSLIIKKDSIVHLINDVKLEEYVAGVVESECGHVKQLDLLRAQAIIARTFALKNKEKHIESGFALCDLTHCQVYKSMCYFKNPILIKKAVLSTSSMILLDEKNELINSVFHSNCGGVTANSEDVWQSFTTYLRSVVDTFCLNQNHSTWIKTIPFNNSTKLACNDFLVRHKLYILNNDTFNLNNFRVNYNLPSTLFSGFKKDDKILLEGKGFGHGVGLCQEGAIRMAELGYNFKQILYFYYTKVRLFSPM